MYNALTQFEVKHTDNWEAGDCTQLITNILIITTWLLITMIILMQEGLGKESIYKKIIKKLTEFIHGISKENMYNQVKEMYQTNYYNLFLLILLGNIIGLIPYTYTITSSLIITLYLSMTYYIGLNLIGTIAQKWKVLHVILPKGIPIIIAPMMICIETISYLAKVLSLSIRLFANMMSGHALLKVLTGFSYSITKINKKNYNSIIIGIIIGTISWQLIMSIYGLESMVGILQAYVFVILNMIYINDVLNKH